MAFAFKYVTHRKWIHKICNASQSDLYRFYEVQFAGFHGGYK